MHEKFGHKTKDGYEFRLKRNCSISPSSLAFIFLALASVSLLIGVVFYFLGAKLILPFSFIEAGALSIAFLYNAFHATDYELLRFDAENIYFESKFGLGLRRETLSRSLTRILPSDKKNLVQLSCGQRQIYFGYNIHSQFRPLLENEIKRSFQS